MKLGKIPLTAISFCSMTLLSSCDSDSELNGGSKFDREKLLESVGNNIILPVYTDYRESVADLKQKALEFTLAPNSQTLGTLRSQFKASYLKWQNCSFYEFGPAEEVLLRASTNTYPANIQNIEANIASGSYDLDAVSNLASIGFPAIDYLIYGNDISDNEIIVKFVDEPARGQYLNDILEQMSTKINSVVEKWIPTGNNYLQQFTVQSGTDAGSSLGMLINEYNRHFERNLRDGKIGIPLGIRTLGEPIPENVEAFYSGESIPYAIENVRAMKLLFQGDFNGIAGLGLDDWLNAANAKFENDLLSNAIIGRFDSALVSLSEIQDPYSATVLESPENANEAYAALQSLTVLLKTDMPSALGILITYQDNDGD